MIGIWVPATKEQAIEALEAQLEQRRAHELFSVNVMAFGYGSDDAEPGWNGLDPDDLRTRNSVLAAGDSFTVDLMDEWGPFRFYIEVPDVFQSALTFDAAIQPISQTELNDAITAYRASGDNFGLLTKARELLADALRWECSSCRPDVGWADAVHMHGDFIHIECGHCGSDYTFTLTGEEVS